MTTVSQNKPVSTWKPVTAGILSIIAGVIAILVALWIFRRHEGFFLMARGERWRASGLFALLVGIMSIIGGIFALIRKAWGAALAGAITALYPFGILGILAIIFVALPKGEFDQTTPKESIVLTEKPKNKTPDGKSSNL